MYQTISVRKELDIKGYIGNISSFFIKAIIMFICIYLTNYIKINGVLKLAIKTIVGIIVYCILNFKYIYNVLNVKKYFSKFIRKPIIE